MTTTPDNDDARTVAEDQACEPEAHYGFQPFASRGTVVSDALVNRLRDAIGA
jgi:hypothetical protein